jgi:two-component system, OmpR family, sensor histidine kinase CreC
LPSADRELFTRQIRDQVERQRLLVERMLELSKLEKRRTLDHRVALDLGHCADAAVNSTQDRARQKHISLRWAPRDAAPVHGEADLLQLAVSNLLENAVDFAPAHSVIELSLVRQNMWLNLTVRDHGPGVPDYAMPRLGQRFFSTTRPAADAEPERRGSGLGLAIVQEVMALHGGRLQLANAEPGLRASLVMPAG